MKPSLRNARVLLALAAASLADALPGQEQGSDPLYRGFLLETMQLDLRAAQTAYEAGALSTELETGTRNRCVARLAELALATHGTAAALAILESLTGTAADLALELPPAADPGAAREALGAAHAEADPTRRHQELTDARERIAAAQREVPRRTRSLYSQVADIAGSGRRDVRRGSAPPPPARRIRASDLRDWIAIVERHLEGDHAAADQLAWFAFRWRPAQPGTDPAVDATRAMERIDRALAAVAASSRQAAVLNRLRDRAREMLDAGDVRGAADLLRRIPLF